MKLRLLSYNIRHGGIGREDAIAGVIRFCEPDVVILQEAVRPEVVRTLCTKCGMKTSGAITGHSVAFLTHLPVAHHAWHKVRFGKRKYLELVLDGLHARIFGVHLSAIHSNLTELRRSFELRSLLNDIGDREDGLHLITGDFNTLAPGEKLDVHKLPARLQAIVWMTGGNIRWHTIRMMLDRKYVDAYRTLHDDSGFTFPTWDPQVRLDYLFLPSLFKDRTKECSVVRKAPGLREASDHFPLLSVIDIQGSPAIE